MQKAKYIPSQQTREQRETSRELHKGLNTGQQHGPKAPLDWILQHNVSWKDYR